MQKGDFLQIAPLLFSLYLFYPHFAISSLQGYLFYRFIQILTSDVMTYNFKFFSVNHASILRYLSSYVIILLHFCFVNQKFPSVFCYFSCVFS